MQTDPVAKFWHREGHRVVCTLCPRYCRLSEGQPGFCYVRQNLGGELRTLAYGKSTGFASDPIEKKPLNHFLPGTQILSFGTAGCNLGCKFCQNWDISKARITDRSSDVYSVEQVLDLAERAGCDSLAFTYNDPTIWAEWAMDLAKAGRERGLRSVMVTAGYITEEARDAVYEHIDAVNVDIKAFTEGFYRKLTLSHLEPVKETVRWLVNERKIWVELTNLMIPGHNDDPAETRELAQWVRDELNADVPLHFTAFHPDYKMQDVPATPSRTLSEARQIALEEGLRYVYVGNVHDESGQTTYCPGCGEAVIVRDWYDIHAYRLEAGKCVSCGYEIAGVFSAEGATPKRGTRRRLTIV